MNKHILFGTAPHCAKVLMAGRALAFLFLTNDSVSHHAYFDMKKQLLF